MKRLLSKFFATAAVAAFAFMYAGQANADVTIDLSGIGVDGGSTVNLFVNNVSGTVTGVDYDFSYAPNSPSWTSELEITVIAPDLAQIFGGSAIQAGAVDIEFGGVNNSDPFAFVGSSALLDGNSSSGTWEVVLGENFDDAGVNPDGVFGQGSTIIVRGVTAAIPEPTSVGLIAIAGLGMIVRRRR